MADQEGYEFQVEGQGFLYKMVTFLSAILLHSIILRCKAQRSGNMHMQSCAFGLIVRNLSIYIHANRPATTYLQHCGAHDIAQTGVITAHEMFHSRVGSGMPCHDL